MNNDNTDSARGLSSPWMWWAALTLTAVFLLWPGPHKSPFSGVPLSSKATIVFLAVVILAVFTASFRPQRAASRWWPAAILALVLVKALLVPVLVVDGWKGVYQTAMELDTGAFTPMRPAYFQNQGPRAQPYRIDRHIDFNELSFGLAFMNEVPVRKNSFKPGKRSVKQPLVVQWTGHVHMAEARALSMEVTAAGYVTVDVDGKRRLSVRDPNGVALSVPVSQGAHRIVATYHKPRGVSPRARITTGERITLTSAAPEQLSNSARASRAVQIIGGLVLVLLIVSFVDSYPAFGVIFRNVWARPDKAVMVVVVAMFLARGAYLSIPWRHATVEVQIGDDPLVYERNARWIARNGLMMRDDDGEAEPYFFYPLYSYGLAGAHILFGDDFSTVYLFNFICLAASVVLVWTLLRNYLSRGALALLLLLVVTPFALRNYGWYATTALSDNIFGPMVLAVIAACAVAFDRKSMRWLFVAGVLTALGAAARASLMTHIAFVGLAILLYRELGGLPQRIRGAAVYAAGFAVGLAPFTLRNWLVSKKLVLLVASVVQMPYFLFYGDDEVPNLLIDGRVATFTESLGQMVTIIASDPLHYTWHEMKKVLVTLGFVEWFGPPGVNAPFYLMLFPPLFALALWLRRVPKPMMFAIVPFCASHMLAMVMAAPWTYGYKTILPFMFACIVGAAFLLRQRNLSKIEVQRAAEPLYRPKVTVIVTGVNHAARLAELNEMEDVSEVITAGGSVADAQVSHADRTAHASAPLDMAAFRRGLVDAMGDLIVVMPDDPAYTAREIRRLIAFGADYDAVFGCRRAERWTGALAISWVLAQVTRILYAAREPLTDVACRMWLVRRNPARFLAEKLRADGDEVVIDALLLSLGEGFRVASVAVTYGIASGSEPSTPRLMRCMKIIAARYREMETGRQRRILLDSSSSLRKNAT